MRRLQTGIVILALALAASCRSERADRRAEFAKKFGEVLRRSEPSARAEVRGDENSILVIESLSDSCSGFLKLVLKGELRGAKELSPSELREPGFTRIECKRSDGSVLGGELSKLDVAYETVRTYALEAYPSWLMAHSDKFCPDKLEELNEYLTAKSINDPWGGTYKMRCRDNLLPPEARGFGVMSLGVDQKEGTEDDVVSWK
jgi:hypothetical protein